MKNTFPSTPALIITGVAIIALATVVIHFKKQQQAAVTASASTPASLCYILNAPTASGYNDVAYLKVTTRDGGRHITGELGTFLSQKDRKSGTLTGSITNVGGNAVFDGQYTNMAEGMNATDEQLIRLNDTQAQIGYGENKKNADGSYSYIDKSKVVYSLSLPVVDCARYDTMKAATGH
jgi:hypothetical protein